METEIFQFEDDGVIPNSKYPVIIYRNCFSERGNAAAEWLENKFAKNNWKNSWRNGIFDYHHYHSNTHEVLGVYKGKALLQLGGKNGKKIEVSGGDVIIIPAGVAHKNLESKDFAVVGAYPQGMPHDMNTGEKGERPGADNNIATVPIPQNDPVQGKNQGLQEIWISEK